MMNKIFHVMIISCAIVMGGNVAAQEIQKVIFPEPFAMVTDDLGWIEGESQGNDNGPWRIGFRHRMDETDYFPFVEIGKQVGVRFQGAFILAEMDRLNICAKYPTTTREKENWDNSDKISIDQINIMKYVVANSAYLEFGLHGVGHEYWPEDGIRKRAEWYNINDDYPWPEQEILNHIKCFKEILDQYDINEEHGHSFPESFVPCAYSYYWNPSAKPYSLGKILNDNGVKYANTLLQEVKELNPPITEGGGYDNGVLVIDRHNYNNYWFEPASLPKKSIDELETNFIEAHWANLIATDDSFQEDLNNRWVEYFRSIQKDKRYYLSKNTEQFNAQWLYKKYTTIEETKQGVIEIDNSNMPDWAYEGDLVKNMVLKIQIQDGKVIESAMFDGAVIPAFAIDQGYAFFYLPPLSKGKSTFTYSIGTKPLELSVDLTKMTFNVYMVKEEKRVLSYEVKVYGSQQMLIHLQDKPKQVISSNKDLAITSWEYHESNNTLVVDMEAHDFQGEKAIIEIQK